MSDRAGSLKNCSSSADGSEATFRFDIAGTEIEVTLHHTETMRLAAAALEMVNQSIARRQEIIRIDAQEARIAEDRVTLDAILLLQLLPVSGSLPIGLSDQQLDQLAEDIETYRQRRLAPGKFDN